ncbi:hypothetical protein AL755_11485 [Arthrobacter sp. ERGS1:01]|uniref:class I adenylate-forming enzyme family protein n=1 Tax=Arthrobacter sp. ERGS1:01 TaxID=1704044 RepID=UPI0006B53A8C|nr:AMP-binding protein [Arthrobacter sp. ERGS1:01]ALE05944.1 hypothetical protein AL755_11485 [Arthrobacter sp. ERGS1:01]
MPFINQLQHWARTRPQHPAVIVGADSLSFEQLSQAAAALHRHEGADGVHVIDTPTSTSLAVEFCAAVAGTGVAAVVDASWPDTLKAGLEAKVGDWARDREIPPAPEPGFTDGPPDTTFMLGLSSGTSGLPKAFTRSRESWRESFVRSIAYFGVGPDDVTLAPGPLAASMNLYALGESLFAGGTFVALPSFSPDAAIGAIKNDGVTRLVLVPAVLGLLAQRGLDTDQGPGAVRAIVCAGAALPPAIAALARRWAPEATIQQYYGASELGFVAASAAPLPDNGTAVGAAFPGVELAILDADGEPTIQGEPGSICVRSSLVSDGYAWGDDGLAFTALDGDWHTVHDQGFLDGDGILNVLGRASDMIVTSGANVYPQLVERALESSEDAGTVVVTGVADPLRGQRVVAGILAGQMPIEQFLTDCRARAKQLPAAARPTQYFALSAAPVTGGGKLSRAQLRDWIMEGDARAQRLA